MDASRAFSPCRRPPRARRPAPCRLRRLAPVIAAAALTAGRAAAQAQARAGGSGVNVHANIADGAILDAESAIELRLDHALPPGGGELALVVGGTDVSAVAVRTPTSIAYQPSALALPPGAAEVVLYEKTGNRWTELRRIVVTVAQAAAGGLSTDESATLGNTGQLAEGHSGGAAAPARRTFQDFVLNAGLRSTTVQNGVTLTTQSNYVGVSRREQALRFGTLSNRAPMFDLSDYVVTAQRPGAQLSVGHVSFGSSRHLANGFAARGGTFTLGQGATTVTFGALNGSAQVGWDDVIGLERPADRLFGAALGREVVASHPGALRLDVTLLDGSKAPLSSFTRSAVIDAEKSEGGSVQLSAALPNQRLRLTGGYTRSRFENPANDPQLVSDSVTKRPRPVTRGARFVELSATPLQGAALPIVGPASVTLGVRDERVDPLFGSIAAATTADRQSDAADATISLGDITAQGSQSFSHDNLGRIASVLRTNTIGSTASLGVPLGRLVRLPASTTWLPVMTVGYNRTHQLADGTPVNGNFRPEDLPDQVSASGDVAAQWQLGRLRASLHANRAAQDNREDQRQNADFASGVTGLTLGTSVGASGDLSLDLAREFQTSKERNETTRVRRLTLNGSLALVAGCHGLASLSVAESQPPAGSPTTDTEEHLELSRSIRLWPGPSGAERGQAFLRYARTFSFFPNPTLGPLAAAPRLDREQWTLASGLNFRVF